VARGFVTGLLSAVPGRDRAALLRTAGIDPAQLSVRAARVPLEDYAALYNVVVRGLDDEGFGLFARPIPRGSFEFLCRGLMGSRDLGEALERAARFLAIVLPDLRVTLARRGRWAEIEIIEMRRLRRRAADPR